MNTQCKATPPKKRRKNVHNDIVELHARMTRKLGRERDEAEKEEHKLAVRFQAWLKDRKEYQTYVREQSATIAVIASFKQHLVDEGGAIQEEVAILREVDAAGVLTDYLLSVIPFLNIYHVLKADLIALAYKERKEQKKGKKRKLSPLCPPTPAVLNTKAYELQHGIYINANAYAEKFYPDLILAHDIAPPSTTGNLFMCDSCKTPTMIETETAHLTCTECGLTEIGRSFNRAKNLAWEQLRQVPGRLYTYKRLNHFREYLRQVQGKSKAPVPDEVVHKLREEFVKCRVPTESITPSKVKLKLSKIKESSYYEQRESLAYRLNPEYELLNIDPVHEEKLCLMFVQLEAPFEQIKSIVDKERKNFMSYPFTFFKLNELNGWDAYNRSCNLLKSVSLINKQDRWWKLVMNELGWENVGRTFDIHRRILK